MRILFTTYPAFGHLHPLVPLALTAQAAGHEVRVVTGPDLLDWIDRCGLSGHAVGLTQAQAASVADRDFAGPDRTGRMFCDVWVAAALPDLLHLTAAWRPDLVVHEEEEYAGVLLAAMLGVPCVTQSWSAPARPEGGRSFASQALAPIWARWLPNEPPRQTGQLYLDACPPAFQSSSIHDIARTSRVLNVRPGMFDGPPASLPGELIDLPRPAAYLSFGTVAVFSRPDLLRELATSLSSELASVFVAAGPNPPSALGELPPNVHAFGYLPQSLVFPTVDLLVSHGGAGGTIGALMHGHPHLVLPGHGESQVSIAAAVQRIGVGLSLAPDHRTQDDLLAAARRLLAESTFRATAEKVRDELTELPDTPDVLAVIEVAQAP